MKIKDYMVTTKDGQKVLRSACIRVKGEFYKREEDAVRLKIDGVNKWLSKTDDRVIFDTDNWKYVDLYTIRTKGRFITYDTVHKSISTDPNCNNKEVCVNDYYGFGTDRFVKSLIKDPVSGIYYKKGSKKPQATRSILYSNLKYSYEQSAHVFNKFKEARDVSGLNALNPGYSYGVELETSKGMVPSDELLENGILPVRDGSTNNYEYVTVPLNNINSLIPVVNSIRKHCEFDITTSLHIHIGNVPTDKEFITKFYRFMHNMQDQIFKMFPKYKSDNILGIKRREYTQKLPNKAKFGTILNFLNNNQSCSQDYTGKMLNHSADEHRTNKWYISSRYYWVNLIPLIFYPSRTIEFRIHQGTLNQYKILYWLLMCIALVEYVKTSDSHDRVDIKDVFASVYDETVSNALSLHYDDMCNYYKNYNEAKDTKYHQDTKDDKSYKPQVRLF